MLVFNDLGQSQPTFRMLGERFTDPSTSAVHSTREPFPSVCIFLLSDMHRVAHHILTVGVCNVNTCTSN